MEGGDSPLSTPNGIAALLAWLRWVLAKPKRWLGLVVVVMVMAVAIKFAGPGFCDIVNALSHSVFSEVADMIVRIRNNR